MRHLLVVEDEPDIRDCYEELFAPPVYETVIVTNGKEASRMVNRNKFDLILTDYRMPWVDGGELYNRIRALKGYESTPIVFVTGFSADLSPEILADKNVAVVEKPVGTQYLETLIEEIFTSLKKQEANKPKSKIDIEMIDMFMKSVEDVLVQASDMENITHMRPYVYKPTEKVVSDVIETMKFETVEISGSMGLLFRSDAYLWLSTVVSATNYRNLETAVEDQGGRLIKMVQKAFWRRLKLAWNEELVQKMECTVQVNEKFEPQYPPVIVPFSSSLGEIHAFISANRET